MREFFAKLDAQRTGYITPEAFSSFLDASNFKTEDNIWKNNLKNNPMYTAQDMADYELKAALEAFIFDHKVVVRDSTRRQLPYGGMPLLSLAGFTDYMSVEYTGEPDIHLPGLNNALRVYNIWPDKGPVPRYLFPATRPTEIQQRIAAGSARSHTTAQTRLDAVKMQHQIEAQGRQNAIDLVSNVRYVYY